MVVCYFIGFVDFFGDSNFEVCFYFIKVKFMGNFGDLLEDVLCMDIFFWFMFLFWCIVCIFWNRVFCRLGMFFWSWGWFGCGRCCFCCKLVWVCWFLVVEFVFYMNLGVEIWFWSYFNGGLWFVMCLKVCEKRGINIEVFFIFFILLCFCY